jgi:hypothetical protein
MGLTEKSMGLFGKGEAKVDKRIREVALFGDEFPIAKTVVDSYTDTIDQCDEVMKSAKAVITEYQDLARRCVKQDGIITLRMQSSDLKTAIVLAQLSKFFEARNSLQEEAEKKKLFTRLGELEESRALKEMLPKITGRITEDPALSVFLVSDASAAKKEETKGKSRTSVEE